MSYYLHRIQREGANFQKGVEVHETLDSALLAYWGRMKLGYGKTNNDFVSCKITDDSGNVVKSMTWLQDGEQGENKFFLHHIRKEGDSYDKAIDILDSIEAATGDFAVQMEYGYGNPQHANVSFVSCYITDLLSVGMVLMDETWVKPEPEPDNATV